MYKNNENKYTGGARPKIKETQYQMEVSPKNGKLYQKNSELNQEEINDMPLEKKELLICLNGVWIKKKALHPDWAENKIFMQCSHPQLLNSDGSFAVGAVETWLEEISFFSADMEWLLSLSHEKFWSQIIYDNNVHNCLDSFLSCRLRWFDNIEYNEDMLVSVKKADQLVFRVYVRMATHKESVTEYISPKVFGELIYDNYVFDCCKFLDLCVLYANTNQKLLSKMISNIFNNQEKYNNDLRMMVSSLKEVLSNIEKELCIFPDKIPIALEKLTTAIGFISDNVFSIISFLKVYPESSHIFYNEHYIERMVLFYQTAIPFISENLSCYSQDGVNVNLLQNKFETARIGALSLFRELLFNLCINPLNSNNLSTEKLEECMAFFIHLTTSAAEEKIFITDYESMFGFAEDLKLYKEVGADVAHLDFIKESVSASVSETLSTYSTNMECSREKVTNLQMDDPVVEDTSGMNGYFDASQDNLSECQIFSLILNVQDLLPDLGTKFVRECLKYYNYSVEDTLNAIFECNLPPYLDSLDRTLADIIENEPSVKTEKKKVKEKSIVDDRANIYNGDEFDTFQSKDTMKKVRQGKKKEILEKPDEDYMIKLKQIGHEYEISAGYSIYEDELKYTPMHATDYDDEYDDTYDGGSKDNCSFNYNDRKGPSIFGKGALNVKGLDFNATPSNSDNDSEATNDKSQYQMNKRQTRKGPLNTKIHSKNNSINKNLTKDKAQKSFEETTNNEQADNQKFNRVSKPIDFCENPEDVRRRAEERYRVKQNNRRPKGAVGRSNIVAGEQKFQMPNYEDGKPKMETETKTNNKPWRQNGENGADSKGGKQKETKNKKENYRNKTIHKNDQKKHGAYVKARGRV